MQMLANSQTLPQNLGMFARLIVGIAVYQSTNSLFKIQGNLFFSTWSWSQQNADILTRATLFIEELKPTFNLDEDDLTCHSLECHRPLALMLLHVPRKDIMNLAHSYNSKFKDQQLNDRLSEWATRENGIQARQAVAYAAMVLTVAKKGTVSAFYEPIAAMLATLVLWTYSQLSDSGPRTSTEGLLSDAVQLERGSVVRLDRMRSRADVSAWSEGQAAHQRPHLSGVGTIDRPRAGITILELGRQTLLDKARNTWAMNQWLASWLGKLKIRTQEALR